MVDKRWCNWTGGSGSGSSEVVIVVVAMRTQYHVKVHMQDSGFWGGTTRVGNSLVNGKSVNYIYLACLLQVCEDEPDFGCNGFDFCSANNGTTCFLTSDHYSDSGVIISNSPICDHYSRE